MSRAVKEGTKARFSSVTAASSPDTALGLDRTGPAHTSTLCHVLYVAPIECQGPCNISGTGSQLSSAAIVHLPCVCNYSAGVYSQSTLRGTGITRPVARLWARSVDVCALAITFTAGTSQASPALVFAWVQSTQPVSFCVSGRVGALWHGLPWWQTLCNAAPSTARSTWRDKSLLNFFFRERAVFWSRQNICLHTCTACF